MATQLVTYFVTSPNLHTQAPNMAGEIYSVPTDQVISPKLSTIEQYAYAVGFDLEINFVPIQKST